MKQGTGANVGSVPLLFDTPCFCSLTVSAQVDEDE